MQFFCVASTSHIRSNPERAAHLVEGGIRLDIRETEELYRRYGPMVLRQCRRMLRDEDAALDALQDVFARWHELGREPPEFPSSFFYTMATRLCIDRLRSGGRQPSEADLLEEIASEEDVERDSYVRRLLDRFFGRQEATTRVMAVLHYVDGLTHEEVGAEMSMSAAGVRRRLQRLRARAAAWNRNAEARRGAPRALPAGKEEQ